MIKVDLQDCSNFILHEYINDDQQNIIDIP